MMGDQYRNSEFTKSFSSVDLRLYVEPYGKAALWSVMIAELIFKLNTINEFRSCTGAMDDATETTTGAS